MNAWSPVFAAIALAVSVPEPLQAEGAASASSQDSGELIGYARPKKDLLIPVPKETKFFWLKNGEQYPIIGEVDTGYLMLVETKDGRKLPALVPYRDRMGSSTQTGHYMGIEEPVPGFFPVKAGSKLPVESRSAGKYTVRFSQQGCDELITVAEADVEFQSLSDFRREIQSVLSGLQAEVQQREKQGDYAGARQVLESYKGRLREETVTEREELVGESVARQAKAEAEKEAEQRAEIEKFEAEQKSKGLVKYEGRWLTPDEAAKAQKLKAEAEARQTEEAARRRQEQVEAYWASFRRATWTQVASGIIPTGNGSRIIVKARVTGVHNDFDSLAIELTDQNYDSTKRRQSIKRDVADQQLNRLYESREWSDFYLENEDGWWHIKRIEELGEK